MNTGVVWLLVARDPERSKPLVLAYVAGPVLGTVRYAILSACGYAYVFDA